MLMDPSCDLPLGVLDHAWPVIRDAVRIANNAMKEEADEGLWQKANEVSAFKYEASETSDAVPSWRLTQWAVVQCQWTCGYGCNIGAAPIFPVNITLLHNTSSW